MRWVFILPVLVATCLARPQNLGLDERFPIPSFGAVSHVPPQITFIHTPTSTPTLVSTVQQYTTFLPRWGFTPALPLPFTPSALKNFVSEQIYVTRIPNTVTRTVTSTPTIYQTKTSVQPTQTQLPHDYTDGFVFIYGDKDSIETETIDQTPSLGVSDTASVLSGYDIIFRSPDPKKGTAEPTSVTVEPTSVTVEPTSVTVEPKKVTVQPIEVTEPVAQAKLAFAHHNPHHNSQPEERFAPQLSAISHQPSAASYHTLYRPEDERVPVRVFNPTRTEIVEEERIEPDAAGFAGHSYSTSDGIHVSQQTKPDDDGFNSVTGSYRYTLPDGKVIELFYVADQRGFRYTSDSLPVGPPEPPHAIEQRRRGEEEYRRLRERQEREQQLKQ